MRRPRESRPRPRLHYAPPTSRGYIDPRLPVHAATRRRACGVAASATRPRAVLASRRSCRAVREVPKVTAQTPARWAAASRRHSDRVKEDVLEARTAAWFTSASATVMNASGLRPRSPSRARAGSPQGCVVETTYSALQPPTGVPNTGSPRATTRSYPSAPPLPRSRGGDIAGARRRGYRPSRCMRSRISAVA